MAGEAAGAMATQHYEVPGPLCAGGRSISHSSPSITTSNQRTGDQLEVEH